MYVYNTILKMERVLGLWYDPMILTSYNNNIYLLQLGCYPVAMNDEYAVSIVLCVN